MGNGGATQTNRLLEEQTNRANALESTIGGRSAEQYSGQEDLRNELLGNYRSLYSGTMDGSGGGGGGGYSYTPVDFSSSSLPFYMEAMNTGLYSPERQGLAESYATGPVTGLYEGLMRTLQTAQAGRGMSPSYGLGAGRIARDQAQQMNQAALAAKLGINREIDTNRFQGAGGVTGIESEKRAFEANERDRAAAAARSRASAADDDRAYQLALLGRMEGLMPSDLPYIDRQLAAQSGARSSITSRANETPLWQQSLASVVPSAVGAGVGAFTGGSSGYRSPSTMPEYNPGLSEDERRYMYGG